MMPRVSLRRVFPDRGGRLLRAVLLALLGLLLNAAPARATEGEGEADARYPIPPERAPLGPPWAVGVSFDVVIPAHLSGLCPAGSTCIGGLGAGVSGWLERRLPRSVGLGFGYDAWFLDGGGVFDTTVVQSFGLGVRVSAFPHSKTHPTAGVAGGLLLLGESFRVATYGGFLDLRAGVLVEMTPTIAFEGTLGARLLTTAAFTSAVDGVARSGGFEVDVVVVAQAGFVFLPKRRAGNLDSRRFP